MKNRLWILLSALFAANAAIAQPGDEDQAFRDRADEIMRRMLGLVEPETAGPAQPARASKAWLDQLFDGMKNRGGAASAVRASSAISEADLVGQFELFYPPRLEEYTATLTLGADHSVQFLGRPDDRDATSKAPPSFQGSGEWSLKSGFLVLEMSGTGIGPDTGAFTVPVPDMVVALDLTSMNREALPWGAFRNLHSNYLGSSNISWRFIKR